MIRRLIFILLIVLISSTIKAPTIKGDFVSYHYEDSYKKYESSSFIDIVIWIESRGDSLAYNQREEAVGILQIRPIMVREVNRILRQKKYTLEDRKSKEKSIEMFWVYQNYYNPEIDFEKMCRIWCGGPDGYRQDETLDYYYKALKEFNF